MPSLVQFTAIAMFLTLSPLVCAESTAAEEGAASCAAFQDALRCDQSLSNAERDRLQASSYLSHTFIWENDSFAAGGDFNYTNGMKLSWIHNPCRHYHEWLKHQFSGALHAMFGNDAYQVSSGGLFGMNMYTPNDLRATARIRTDRPYAGWVYGGINLQAATMVAESADSGYPIEHESHQLELQFGFTGPKTAQREAQSYIHRNITTGSPIPQGWDNQVGQRLGVNALYAYRRNFYPSPSIRVVPHAGFSLGNLVQFANVGGELLIGRSGSDYPGTTILPTNVFVPQAIPSTVQDAIPLDTDPNESHDSRKQFIFVRPRSVLYAFVGLDARYVANSIFVEGYGDSAHDISLIHGVYDLIYGFAWGNQNWRLAYKVIERSKEFHSPDASLEKSHRIGQFTISWYF